MAWKSSLATSKSHLAGVAGLTVGTVLLTLSLPYLPATSSLFSFVNDFPIPDYPTYIPFRSSAATPSIGEPEAFVCQSQNYQTEIISLDPLVIYIHHLISTAENAALLQAGEKHFAPSQVTKSGRQSSTSDRTSSSAGLPRDDAAVRCALARARAFMGTMLTYDWDDIGPPQLVRYTQGQRFNIHHDWYPAPRWANDDSGRKWNRVASFFAILQSNCTGGETHFPYVTPISKQIGHARTAENMVDDQHWKWTDSDPAWRSHPKGGVAFRPIAGNAVFWVNLHANGTGDRRTMHAGLPVGDGLKTAMNIWPRKYYAAE